MNHRNYNNRFLKIVNKFHLLIFQHFEVSDILSLTAVGKEINAKLSNCAHCMTLLLLHISLETVVKQRDLNCLLQSGIKRNYRNVKLSCSNDFNLSFLCMKILENYSKSIVNLDVNGMKLKDDEIPNVELKKLMNLKISSVNKVAMKFLLNLSQLFHKLTVQDVSWTIEDSSIANLIMSYKTVRLLNVHINSLTNIDFMFNNCIDFILEYDQVNDFTSLCEILQNALNSTEIIIRRKDKNNLDTKSFKFSVHRFKGSVGNLSPKMFERKNSKNSAGYLIEKIADGNKKRKIEVIDKNSNFQPTKFAITLAIDEISWTMLEKLGRILTNLNTLKIFDIPDRKKIEIFKNFKNLQLITIESLDELESEVFYARSEFEIKTSRDPLLNFDPKIRSLIFQHLSFEDFLQSCEVSSKWNQIISENSSFNSKIVCNLNHDDFISKTDQNPPDHPINSKTFSNEIMKSKKYFENFNIQCGSDIKIVLQFQNLIHNFSQFLVELKFSDVKMKSQQIINFLIFPRLKVLKLKSVDENFCKMIFTNLTTLEVLKLEIVNFHNNFRTRLRNQNNLKKIYFRDCNFSSFEAEDKEFEFKFLEFVEVSFNQANSWKSAQNSFGISQFLFSSNFRKVKNLKVSGVRGETLTKFFKYMKNIENLEIIGFWASDINNMDVNFQKINLYVPNFFHLDEFPWRKAFRGLQTVFASSIEKSSQLHEGDQNFKKFLRGSATKMIENKLYQLDNSSMDPLMKLPEEIHEIIFQHFNGKDALNSLEVSQSWKIYGAQARNLMTKIQLNVYEDMSEEDVKAIENSLHKFQTVLCYSSKLPVLRNFCKYVKKITIIVNDNRDLSKEELEFPNLESLIVKTEFCYHQSSKHILKVFVGCKKLKTLIIKSEISSDNFNHVEKILTLNSDLTEVRLDNFTSYQKLFSENVSEKFNFKLSKFSFGIPANDTIYNTIYEENLLKFLKVHKETIEEVFLSHSSANIVNELFPNFKNLKTFHGTYFIGYDEIVCTASTSIKKFLIPLSSFEGCQTFIQRLPLVEFLYIFGIDLEILRDVVLHLAYLKVLSFCNDRNNCTRHYDQIVADNDYVNRTLKFRKVDRAKFENLNFEKLYGGYEDEFDG